MSTSAARREAMPAVLRIFCRRSRSAQPVSPGGSAPVPSGSVPSSFTAGPPTAAPAPTHPPRKPTSPGGVLVRSAQLVATRHLDAPEATAVALVALRQRLQRRRDLAPLGPVEGFDQARYPHRRARGKEQALDQCRQAAELHL